MRSCSVRLIGNQRQRDAEKERKKEALSLFDRLPLFPPLLTSKRNSQNKKTEEDAASWQEAVHLSALSPRYRAALEGAATALRSAGAAVAASRGGGGGGGSRRRTAANDGDGSGAPPAPPASSSAGSALVLNLGPAWSSASAYALFDDAVIELPFRDWEGPPGLCAPPLGDE